MMWHPWIEIHNDSPESDGCTNMEVEIVIKKVISGGFLKDGQKQFLDTKVVKSSLPSIMVWNLLTSPFHDVVPFHKKMLFASAKLRTFIVRY